MRLIGMCLFLFAGAAAARFAATPASIPSPAATQVRQGGFDELSRRKALMAEVRQHIDSRNFEWLDSEEEKLRTQRSRTATGVWKLELFYDSMFYLGRLAPPPDCTDSADPVLAQWLHASPDSPAPFIIAAQRLLDRGWCIRGAGYAQEVNPSAWESFNNDIQAAYGLLTEHKAVASVDPQYYAVMAQMYIAQGRSEGEFQALLNEAVQREPYYYPLYNEAFRYYEPQWFGSYEAENAFAHFAVQQTRGKDRTSVMARIYWHALECGCMPPPDAVDRPALRQSMKDLADLYPSPWNDSHLAGIACAMNDGDLARHYFEALPPGDDGKSGWVGWDKVDVSGWSACRTMAGLPAA